MTRRVFIFQVIVTFCLFGSSIANADTDGRKTQTGSMPEQWFTGDANCEDAREYHIHAYNDNWPEQIVSYDLGQRALDIIPLPAHDVGAIAIYDRQTGILLTGDHIYPGYIYTNSGLDEYIRSTRRLVDFTADKPVAHVLGSHINYSATAFKYFGVGTPEKPREHVLELGRAHLLELLDALEAMDGKVTPVRLRDFEICKSFFNSGC